MIMATITANDNDNDDDVDYDHAEANQRDSTISLTLAHHLIDHSTAKLVLLLSSNSIHN